MTSSMRILTAATIACLLHGLAPSDGLAQAPAPKEPAITWSEIPPSDCGGPGAQAQIAGKITIPNATNYRVVIYAQACNAMFYVQPTAAAPMTVLDGTGRFDSYIHLGHTYYILLVKPAYKPAAQETQMPAKGGDVVAVFAIAGKKK